MQPSQSKQASNQSVTAASLQQSGSVSVSKEDGGIEEIRTDSFENDGTDYFHVPPLDKLLVPLLYNIYCLGGSVQPDHDFSSIQDDYWVEVKDDNELQSGNSEFFNARIQEALHRLATEGLVRRDECDAWEITAQGNSELDSRGLV